MDEAYDGIELRDLTKVYKGVCAVDHVTLRIGRGEIFGILGPNGSGKTTTFLMLLGFTGITEGTASVFGIDPVRDNMRIKKTVAYLPDTLGFYAHMRAIDNLLYTGRLLNLGREEALALAQENLALVGLTEAADKYASQLSRGMRQRLGIADLLMKKPKVLILDEPTLGLDPGGAAALLELIVRLSRRQGMTVLLSSHQLEHVRRICDRIAIFRKGKLVDAGAPAEVIAAMDARRPPLGEICVETPEEAAFSRLAALTGVRDVRRDGPSTVLTVERGGMERVLRALLEEGFTVKRMDDKSATLEEVYRYYFGTRVEERTP